MANKEDMNGLGPTDKVVDMGDLHGNPIKDDHKHTEKEVDLDDIELTPEEEEMLKKKLDDIRNKDPFIYR